LVGCCEHGNEPLGSMKGGGGGDNGDKRERERMCVYVQLQ